MCADEEEGVGGKDPCGSHGGYGKATIRESVLSYVDNYGANSDEARWDEERFGGMKEGGAEGVWIEVETEGDHEQIEDKKNDIENGEYATYSVEAMEPEWYFVLLVSSGRTRSGEAHRKLPELITFAIPPVDIVMVKKAHVKCLTRPLQPSILGSTSFLSLPADEGR
ncbi:MAG: hypothetical protein M1836_002169 [Candelina mexicana]|nr:MAG: hypothetical protein M1836_002169 [Candelina mexicana]